MKNPEMFKVAYHQIGNDSDADDWIYSYVVHEILLKGFIPNKFTASSSPKEVDGKVKSIKDTVNDLLSMIPNGRVIFSSDDDNRLTTQYCIVDNTDLQTFLSLSLRNKQAKDYATFKFITSDESLAESLKNYYKENFEDNKQKGIYVIAQGSGGGLQLYNLGELHSPLVRENYSQEVLNSYDYVVREFNKPEPNGRLVILNGSPGTGKTFMVRSLIDDIKNSITILLPSKLVGEIDSPSLITLIAEEKSEFGLLNREGNSTNLSILFIVEDADACLVPRGSDNMSTISSLLNYTSGIFGSMLDLRMVATTNADRLDFDSALTRPGRLCRHLNVPELSPEHASEIYCRLTGKKKKYKESVSLAAVYADANSSDTFEGFEKAAERKVGF